MRQAELEQDQEIRAQLPLVLHQPSRKRLRQGEKERLVKPSKTWQVRMWLLGDKVVGLEAFSIRVHLTTNCKMWISSKTFCFRMTPTLLTTWTQSYWNPHLTRTWWKKAWLPLWPRWWAMELPRTTSFWKPGLLCRTRSRSSSLPKTYLSTTILNSTCQD